MQYISSPEFINLQPLDINPLMSKCEIRVMYVGENRNHTIISKDVAQKMAKTLRGCPIVGYYKEDVEDFGDHGHTFRFDEENGLELVVTSTKPYGFVAPDAKVWFQQVKDNAGEDREYLMAEGYLWTAQFPECQSVVNNGKGQSMELDEDTLQGEWTHNAQSHVSFFIINDATFSKLCILGDEVEPCFEDAAITGPKNYSFKQTLFSMMEDLKQVLGGNQMDTKELEGVGEYVSPKKKEEEAEAEKAKAEDSKEKAKAEDQKASDQKEEAKKDEKAAKDEEDKKKKKNFTQENSENENKKNYELLELKLEDLTNQFNELNTKFALVNKEVEELRDYKRINENVKKDKMIQEDFYMLSEKDKEDVIKNKENYTLEEIESKLSVIAVRNKVDFSAKKSNDSEKPATDFSFDVQGQEKSTIPAYIEAMRQAKQQNGY